LKVTPPDSGTTTSPDSKVKEAQLTLDGKDEIPTSPKVENLTPETKKSILKPPTTSTEPVPTVHKDDKFPIKPVTPVKEQKEDQFDYSKFSQQEVTNLKNMSRQSREYVAKLIDENKQLQTLKDATYLQHEQGFVLSPDYQNLQQKASFASVEGQCWEQALLNIRAGKTFRDIVGFDPKTGEPVMSEERNPTDRDEIRVNNNLSACINASKQFDAGLEQFPQQFKHRVGQDMATIDSVRKQKFSWIADPKILDYTVSIEGQGEKRVRDIKNDFKSMFPNYLSSTPGVEVASDLMVALVIQGAELAEARNGKQIEQIKREEIGRGEPTSDAREVRPTSLSAKGIPSVFSLDGFPSS